VVLSTPPVSYSGASLSVETWFLRIVGFPEVFHVVDHTAGDTTLTLDQAYFQPSATDLGYLLFKLDYALASDVLRVVAPMRTYQNTGFWSRNDYKIYGTDLDSLEEEYPLPLIESGVPDLFSPIGEDVAGIRRVRFNRCGSLEPSTVYRVEYEYLVRPAPLTSPGTAEEPLVPLEWRHVLADFTAAYLLGLKHDDRAGMVGQAAQRGLAGMAAENRYQKATATRNMFRLQPRWGGRRRSRLPLRTESGLLVS